MILWPPAVLHFISTYLLNTGMEFTTVASFQILKGSSIVFVVLMSCLFLKRHAVFREWIGLCIIICGLGVVGIADIKDDCCPIDENILGDCLVILGHFMKACQMVYEEHFVSKNDIPSLQAIGWEGIYGLIIVVIFLFPAYFIEVPPPFDENAGNVLEDAPDGFTLIANNSLLLVPTFGSIISIAFYNYTGLSITKEISSTTRLIFEFVCVIIVSSFSFMVGWEEFNIWRILGFLIISFGMCAYSKFVITNQIFKLFSTHSSAFPPATAF